MVREPEGRAGRPGPAHAVRALAYASPPKQKLHHHHNLNPSGVAASAPQLGSVPNLLKQTCSTSCPENPTQRDEPLKRREKLKIQHSKALPFIANRLPVLSARAMASENRGAR